MVTGPFSLRLWKNGPCFLRRGTRGGSSRLTRCLSGPSGLRLGGREKPVPSCRRLPKCLCWPIWILTSQSRGFFLRLRIRAGPWMLFGHCERTRAWGRALDERGDSDSEAEPNGCRIQDLNHPVTMFPYVSEETHLLTKVERWQRGYF